MFSLDLRNDTVYLLSQALDGFLLAPAGTVLVTSLMLALWLAPSAFAWLIVARQEGQARIVAAALIVLVSVGQSAVHFTNDVPDLACHHDVTDAVFLDEIGDIDPSCLSGSSLWLSAHNARQELPYHLKVQTFLEFEYARKFSSQAVYNDGVDFIRHVAKEHSGMDRTSLLWHSGFLFLKEGHRVS